MKRYSIRWHEERCTGCQACMVACMDEKDIRPSEGEQPGCRVRVTGQPQSPFWELCICRHCRKPACVQVCVSQALHRDVQTGLVLCEPERCIGCGRCASACPAGAITLDHHRIARKCDGCAERIRAGLLPACVRACPGGALTAECTDTDTGIR